MALETALTRFQPQLLSLLRIIAGLSILQHGTSKYLKLPPLPMYKNTQFLSAGGIAGALELIGGALMVLGLFTRHMAFILSGLMAVAYFMAHAPKGFYPIANGGELAVMYCFVFLYLAAAGGGQWSLDAMARNKR